MWGIFFAVCVLASIFIAVVETTPRFREKLTQKSLNSITLHDDLQLKTLEDSLNSSDFSDRKRKAMMSTVIIPLYYADCSLNGFFCVELLLRFFTSPEKKGFFCRLSNLFDLVAVMASWVPRIIMLLRPELLFENSTVIKVTFLVYSFRIFRVFRLFRMARFVVGLRVLILTIKSSMRELALLLLVMAIGMVIFASLVYYAEFEVDQSDFPTIPSGFWWSVVTMTTVGYGEVVPKGWMGYIVGMLCAICGIVITGLTIPIISKNFDIYYNYAESLEAAKRANDKAIKRRKHIEVGPLY